LDLGGKACPRSSQKGRLPEAALITNFFASGLTRSSPALRQRDQNLRQPAAGVTVKIERSAGDGHRHSRATRREQDVWQLGRTPPAPFAGKPSHISGQTRIVDTKFRRDPSGTINIAVDPPGGGFFQCGIIPI
jgi:hypothetical protein